MVDIRHIPGANRYGVDNLGSVWCIYSKKRLGSAPYLLNPYFDKDGYLRATIFDDTGKKVRPSISRFVCAAFHGPAPKGKTYACHRNGIKTDNRPENVYWGTPAENGQDKQRLGEATKGEANHMSKVTAEQVREMRALHSAGASYVELAKRYSMTDGNVWKIVNRWHWRHID